MHIYVNMYRFWPNLTGNGVHSEFSLAFIMSLANGVYLCKLGPGPCGQATGRRGGGRSYSENYYLSLV